jgi:hypothetical protein
LADEDDLLKRLGAGVAATVDRAFYKLALTRSSGSRAKSRAESLGPVERIDALRQLVRLYEGVDGAFFPEAPAARPALRPVRSGAGFEVFDASWESGYGPFLDDVGERYLGHEPNRTAHARLFLNRQPGPAVLLVHGYLGGNPAVEERMWPLEWMLGKGLDVALTVLPFHGPRGRPSPLYRPPFPNSDPRVTIEGFRHAMLDLRALSSFFLGRGSPAVGVMGMSLGGYTAALFATVEPRLRFVVPIIPLSSIADFARDGGRLIGTASQQEEQHRLLEQVYRVVSPLGRTPLAPPEGRLVVAGEVDRIAPIEHARRIADHFEAPLETFYGGHLLQLGRGRGFRAAARMLGKLGLLK